MTRYDENTVGLLSRVASIFFISHDFPFFPSLCTVIKQEIKYLIASCEAVDEAAEKYERAQMDSTLYTLTVICAIFLPAQFLTGYVQSAFRKVIFKHPVESSFLIKPFRSFLLLSD